MSSLVVETASADAWECATINAVAVITLTARNGGFLPHNPLAGASLGRII
jgi:hypothetical protein